ncbi:hypothetical protein JKF63_03173 [Porcisia hertigi]|uniref:Uncharacterized protein n=1 Tax=Porcisia hertigi TaxID=2761500 RepID=A0A836HYH8_9TRYP|nr:hypothetical protein JKF63_03173 [Porcisia hertigi]
MAHPLMLLLSLLVLFVPATAHEFHLPADIYENAAGEWSVEVLSSCRSPLLGVVTFQNTTAVVDWQEEGAPEMTISGQSAVPSLSMSALADFLTKDGHELSYTVCEHQENYLGTPQRPVQVADMTTTYMRTYSGELNSPPGGSTCDGTSQRSVFIQALGAPFKTTNNKAWRVQEALYAIEIIIDTRGVKGACVGKRNTGALDSVLESKKVSRKRRAHRLLNSGVVVSKADEMTAENGIVTLRFIRRTSSVQSWFLRYNSPIVFAIVFITYRGVHAFFSARASRS